MSTGEATATSQWATDSAATGPWSSLESLVRRLSPREGWATFVLLMLVLLTAVWSVYRADWVDTPNLSLVMFAAAFSGLLLAKLKYPSPLLHLAGLVVGFVVVAGLALGLTDATSPLDQVKELWTRVDLWTGAAFSGGISTDLLPVSLIVTIFVWIVGYLSSWAIFRWGNMWIGILVPGIGILTNLSYLPDRFAFHFLLFILASMLLVARMTTLKRHAAWERSGISFSTGRSWMFINEALWFSAIVIGIVYLAPLWEPRSGPLRSAWSDVRWPVRELENELTRLLSGVPARKGVSFRIFGSSLPFKGEISLKDAPILWADSRYPSYWTSRNYSVYTSQGWQSGDTLSLDVDPEGVPPPPQGARGRTEIIQTVQVGYATPSMFTGGNLTSVDRKATVEVLAPRQYDIDLEDFSGDSELPGELSILAQRLRDELRPGQGDLRLQIGGLLPSDMLLQEMHFTGRGDLRAVTVERKVPFVQEISSIRFNEPLEPGEPYTITSSVPLASDQQLRGAGTDYPSFVTDHYLQLPASLPQRVRDLAEQVTEGQDNVMEVIASIQEYLSGLEYSLEIEAPPFDSDGVDHFLFEARKGYGEYFASAMAVMLRAVGVPARVAAGYSPGEFDPEQELNIVRDTDSHAWAEVYFPEYGWINFEVTPGRPAPQRSLRPLPEAAEFGESSFTSDEDEDLFDDEEDFLLGPIAPLPSDSGGISSTILITIPSIVTAIALVWLAGWYFWHRRLVTAGVAEMAYAKMNRLSYLARLRRRPFETAGEYAMNIGRILPAMRGEAKTIVDALDKSRYGRRPISSEEATAVEKAWRRLRVGLLGQVFRL